MNILKLFWLILFSTLVDLPAFGQLKNVHEENNQWSQGTIKFLDGRTINGLLNYNFITGVLSHKHGSESDPYFARKVTSFTLFDSLNSTIKEYYSLPFKTEKSKIERFIFFENIYEKNGIAILSRHEYEFKETSSSSSGSAFNPPGFFNPETYGTRVVEKIFENIYLANNKGDILKYAFLKKDQKSTSVSNYQKKIRARII